MSTTKKTPKKQDVQPTHITGCNFVGVQFDAEAVSAIETIAQGLVENAKAIGYLAQVLKASNVEIGAMLKIGGIEK